MPVAVALVESEVPLLWLARADIQRRLYQRGGEPEVRFHYRDRVPVVPVWSEGQLQLIRWGNRSRSGGLPPGGWTWRSTLEGGGWLPWRPEPVEIRASYALDRVGSGIRCGRASAASWSRRRASRSSTCSASRRRATTE